MSESPTVSTRGVADRPHTLSVALAFLALLISLMSFWESHKNRVISEDVNRPRLYVAALAFEERLGVVEVVGKPYRLAMFRMTLKNTGKGLASRIHGKTCVSIPNLGPPISRDFRVLG
jgi:hypothetical protein